MCIFWISCPKTFTAIYMTWGYYTILKIRRNPYLWFRWALKKKKNIFDHFANISSLKQLFGYRFLELNNVSKFRGSSWSYGSFTTTCEISVYHHLSCASNLVHGKVYSIQLLCDKVCQWLATGQWFSLGTPVSSTNKTDHHNITEILLFIYSLFLFI